MLVDFAVEISLPFAPGIGWSPGLSDKVEFRDFNLTEREFPMTDDRLPLAELESQVRTFEVLTATAVSPRRPPRHWPDDEKARLVGEAFSPGSTVAEVARAYELDVSQL